MSVVGEPEGSLLLGIGTSRSIVVGIRVGDAERSSRDEKLVCIDAPDGANGRQLHLIDIQGLMG